MQIPRARCAGAALAPDRSPAQPTISHPTQPPQRSAAPARSGEAASRQSTAGPARDVRASRPNFRATRMYRIPHRENISPSRRRKCRPPSSKTAGSECGLDPPWTDQSQLCERPSIAGPWRSRPSHSPPPSVEGKARRAREPSGPRSSRIPLSAPRPRTETRRQEAEAQPFGGA